MVVGRLSVDESGVELGKNMCQISLKLGWEYGKGPNVSMLSIGVSEVEERSVRAYITHLGRCLREMGTS